MSIINSMLAIPDWYVSRNGCSGIGHFGWHPYGLILTFKLQNNMQMHSIFSLQRTVCDHRLLYSSRVQRQPLHPEPVFVLGHPRTGTTHLHNLLALDPTFAFCTTFNAGVGNSLIGSILYYSNSIHSQSTS